MSKQTKAFDLMTTINFWMGFLIWGVLKFLVVMLVLSFLKVRFNWNLTPEETNLIGLLLAAVWSYVSQSTKYGAIYTARDQLRVTKEIYRNTRRV